MSKRIVIKFIISFLLLIIAFVFYHSLAQNSPWRDTAEDYNDIEEISRPVSEKENYVNIISKLPFVSSIIVAILVFNSARKELKKNKSKNIVKDK